MLRLKIVLSLILLIVILSGCTTNSQTDEEIYLIGIDEIKNVKVNELFEIQGYLKNNSKQTLDISHGSGMFTYEVYDEDGVKIFPNNSILFRNDIGYTVEIKSNAEYRDNGEGQRSDEYYQFVIQKPGTYKVKANVEFWVESKGNKEQINLSSDLVQFIVE